MSHHAPKGPVVHAMVAEFDSADALLAAADRARETGYTEIEAYSPFPVHGMSEATGFKCSIVPWIFFVGGFTGACTGMFLEWYISVIDLPLNIGGKPPFSIPSFFPVMYECTILFAAVSGALGMLALNGLPKPYHPIFSTPNFEKASQDRFFLAIEAIDPQYDDVKTQTFLNGLKPINVSVVEEEE
jgi:ActD protein